MATKPLNQSPVNLEEALSNLATLYSKKNNDQELNNAFIRLNKAIHDQEQFSDYDYNKIFNLLLPYKDRLAQAEIINQYPYLYWFAKIIFMGDYSNSVLTNLCKDELATYHFLDSESIKYLATSKNLDKRIPTAITIAHQLATYKPTDLAQQNFGWISKKIKEKIQSQSSRVKASININYPAQPQKTSTIESQINDRDLPEILYVFKDQRPKVKMTIHQKNALASLNNYLEHNQDFPANTYAPLFQILALNETARINKQQHPKLFNFNEKLHAATKQIMAMENKDEVINKLIELYQSKKETFTDQVLLAVTFNKLLELEGDKIPDAPSIKTRGDTLKVRHTLQNKIEEPIKFNLWQRFWNFISRGRFYAAEKATFLNQQAKRETLIKIKNDIPKLDQLAETMRKITHIESSSYTLLPRVAVMPITSATESVTLPKELKKDHKSTQPTVTPHTPPTEPKTMKR